MTAGNVPTRAPRLDDSGAAAGAARRLAGWRWPALAAVLFLAAHLAFPAPTLDDIDAVNFAFGVRSFDPAAHHPHPPGYPVYIALAKLSTSVVDALRPADRLAPLRRDNVALALAWWSAIWGAVCLLACYAVFRRLDALDARGGSGGGSPGAAPRLAVPASAAVLAAVAPLTWLTSSRPMSDVPGLGAALIAQALLLQAWPRDDQSPNEAGGGNLAGTGRARAFDVLALGALVAGFSLGIRSQVLWLTLPLLAAVVATRATRLGARAILPAILAYAAGIVAWAIPLIAVTGLQRYIAALGGQGAEDFSGVDMLWTHPGLRRLAVGLWHTFVLPWSSVPLALLVLLGAAAGVFVMRRRGRAALALLALSFGPYAVFHLLFQETVTTRYALPLVPAICYLAVRAWAAAGRRVSLAVLSAAVTGSLLVGVPSLRTYASTPSPIFQAVERMEACAGALGGRAVLGMHRRISTEARVALQWAAVAPWSRRLPSPRGAEWRQALNVLREEPDRPVWFLAEPSREGELRVRDLALVDPRARTFVERFDWGFDASGLLAGVRPSTLDLYEIDSPGWIAGEGWSLTPETAGVAATRRVGPSFGPIEALVRRRPDETVLVLGGRHLGGADDGPARVDVSVDGRQVADIVIGAEPRFFLRLLRLPAGTLAGAGYFARLAVQVRPADGGSRVIPAAIEQFDIDGVDGVVAGYDTGWQEAEYDPARQRLWRWMSERAAMLVHAGGSGPLTLRLTAESPRRYFDRASEVRILVGDDVLARTTPDARLPRLLARLTGAGTFVLSAAIDRAALDRADGRITIEANQFFVPADREQNADRRHLALRVLGVEIVSR